MDLMKIVEEENEVKEQDLELNEARGSLSDMASLMLIGKMTKQRRALQSEQDIGKKLDHLADMIASASAISVINGKSSKKSIWGKIKKFASGGSSL